MRFLPARDDLSVAIVGFGYVGSSLGVTLAEAGLRVMGVDSDERLIEELRGGHCRFGEPGLAVAVGRLSGSDRLSFSTAYDVVSSAHVVILTVGTPVNEDGSLVTSHLESACRNLARHLQPGQLVILKSTVPPGTTRQFVLPLLESGGMVEGRDFGLAFSPERLAESQALEQLHTLPILVGGCSEESTLAAADFWKRCLGVEVLTFDTPEVPELVKLADNWWIDLNIAMANELAKVSSALGIDVLDVVRGANSLPKGHGSVNILLPSVGVGGSCLTKDPWMVWQSARDLGVELRTVETARSVNDAMPHYAFEQIRDELAKLGKALSDAKVAVLGLAFKNNTGDMRNTPTKPVVARLIEAGADVSVFDPLVPDEEVASMIGLPQATSAEAAVKGADCVAVLAGHTAFKELDFVKLRDLVSMPCVVLDGRAYYPRTTIAHLRDLGFVYRGIGR